MNKLNKFFIFLILNYILLFSFTTTIFAQEEDSKSIDALDPQSQVNALALKSNMDSDMTIGLFIGLILEIGLTLLGVFFVILVVYAGFIWMNARGNTEEASKSRGILQTAIIGLIITVTAYSITHFVFSALGKTGFGGN